MTFIVGSLFAILFILTSVLTLVIHSKAKGQYDYLIEDLDKKEWALKDFMHLGFQIQSWEIKKKLPEPIRTWYEQYDYTVYSKIIALYGKRLGGEKIYYVYQANKSALALVVLILISIFAPLVAYSNESLTQGIGLWLGAIVLVPGVTFMIDHDLNKKLKKREIELMLEFPVFASKFLLLVDAGMTTSRAIHKVVVENKKNNKLYIELNEMLRSIESGTPEIVAYEEFARRCRVREITRFVSILVQSINKGSSDLSATLKLQVQECWEARKSMAKKLGSEASTKLVIPLMLMMIGIVMIVAAPAMFALQGF